MCTVRTNGKHSPYFEEDAAGKELTKQISWEQEELLQSTLQRYVLRTSATDRNMVGLRSTNT